ncbi:MAG: hypothetical protein KAT30_07110, partial [Candidatus Krumholzibacteria bacterium]|nr:hypothetical protein [Candidatus Krumholzibacteria bacterium]
MNRKHAYLLAVVLLVAGAVTPVGASELTAWDLVYKARVAAEKDEHRESINLYLAAVEKKPLVLSSVAIELAHQYTWAEMPDSAIYWYEYTLLGEPN